MLTKEEVEQFRDRLWEATKAHGMAQDPEAMEAFGQTMRFLAMLLCQFATIEYLQAQVDYCKALNAAHSKEESKC